MGYLYNAGSRARHVSSITNQNQGGGNKKAGLVPTETASVATALSYRVRGLPLSLMRLQVTENPNVMQSRPVWVRSMNFKRA
jgi:hypothetical protein